MKLKLKYFGILVLTSLVLSSAPSFASDEPLELYPDDASDACVPNSRQIRATIEGVTAVGIMKLELYNLKEGFLRKKNRLRSIRDAAQNAPQIMCVNVPKIGEYALSAYHDIDGNRKLKKTWKFRPREPFGLSNNPEYSESMPKFENSAFYVGEAGVDIVIKLVDYKQLKDELKKK